MNDKKVLIIDDEEDCITFIKKILENQGINNILSAKDGEEGLSKIKKEKPNLIILDIQMPKMNGFQVFNILSKDPVINNIPVIILTAINDQIGIKVSKNHIKDYYGKEPEAYLEKPIKPELLAEMVKRYLNN